MPRRPSRPMLERLISALDAEIISREEQHLRWVRNGIPIISSVYLVKRSCQLVYLVRAIVGFLTGWGSDSSEMVNNVFYYDHRYVAG